MSDVVERAKDWASSAEVAHTYGVSVPSNFPTIGMVRELVAEVERLRDLVAEFRKRDESATRVIESQKAEIERLRDLYARTRTEAEELRSGGVR